MTFGITGSCQRARPRASEREVRSCTLNVGLQEAEREEHAGAAHPEYGTLTR